MKSCWVKKSLRRDQRSTQKFSRLLSNTGQSFRRSSATGRRSKMENLALPNFVKRKSILMRSSCVLSEASAERCSKNIPKVGKGNSSSSKGLIGGSLWVVVRILCGMTYVSRRAQSSPTGRHEQLLWPACYEISVNRQTDTWHTKNLWRRLVRNRINTSGQKSSTDANPQVSAV